MRIYLNHRPVSKPWGGANNFIRTLYEALRCSEQFEFAENIEDDYDILFLNEFKIGTSTLPKESLSKRLKKFKKIRKESDRKKKIVVRAVNLKRHSQRFGFQHIFEDAAKIKLLNTADMVIFQSNYQKGFFTKYGYKGKNNVVIHNGADTSVFNEDGSAVWDGGGKLRIVSSSIAVRRTKRHDLIAKVSECDEVEVSHIGNWPDSIDKKNVKLLGLLECKDIAAVLKGSHVFLHPAVKDPCPNVISEAICCGLPVIYNDEISSSKEIVQDNGLPINEKNVEETIRQVKDCYHKLKENVKQTRSYYSINRAADEYIRVFTEVAGL